MGVSSTFAWLGHAVQDALLGRIDQRLRQAGEAVVAEARALAPARTGALRAGIDHRIEDRTLIITVSQPYAIFQEFGTRTIRPHPFLRPALAAAGRVFGGSIEMQFNTLASSAGGGWSGIHATGGGFVIPRGLTAKQRAHVEKHLVPTSRKLHRGNVKRARMRVRRFGS